MIGYYAHHHGRGHLTRAAAVARRLGEEVTVLGSGDLGGFDCPTVRLALDTDLEDPPATEPAELHHAPVGSKGLADRMAAIAAWIAGTRPALMVVDVSVEVALLSRLCGVPFVYVRQTGEREDPPHLIAYRWARALWGPYLQAEEDRATPRWIQEKTGYSGAVTRFDGEPRPVPPSREGGRALVVGEPAGAGGRALVEGLGRCRRWRIDRASGAGGHRPLGLAGFVDHAVIVGAGGNNLVAETAFARRGLVCVPEERPFGEQDARAARLEAEEAAIVIPRQDPGIDPLDDPDGLLDRALERAARLEAWADGAGAERAAALIRDWAAAPA